MALASKLNEALEIVESLPLSDDELLALPLYLARIPISTSLTPEPLTPEPLMDESAGTSSPQTEGQVVGQLLSVLLIERQNKGATFNHTRFLTLLDRWGVSPPKELLSAPQSAFFLGSSL